jgi:branched-chain amino acid transport system permease protein
MTQFLQALFNGVSVAGVYALLALGFVIIYKSMQVLSFAQPAMMLIGGYYIILFATDNGLNFYLSVAIAVVFAAITGVVIERLFLHPMVGKPVFAVAIMTIGIDVMLRIIAGDSSVYGSGGLKGTSDPWGLGTFNWAGLVFGHRRIAAIVVAGVTVAGLLAFLRYTRIGLAMRATAFDQEVALTQGVSVSTVFALSWALAAVLAVLAAPFVNMNAGSLGVNDFVFALRALPVVVIGGLDSIGGALVAALLVAVIEQLVSVYQTQHFNWVGVGFAQVVPYLIMFVVLLVRPYGLFGTKEVERV